MNLPQHTPDWCDRCQERHSPAVGHRLLPPSGMTAQGAIRTVARRVIIDCVVDAVGEMWEMYPEIGEHDWDAVCAEVDLILRANIKTPDDEYDEAYALLRNRAGDADGLAFTRWGDLPCLDCGTPLSEARPEYARQHRCKCGIIYADALLDQADPDEWQRIINRDGFTTKRDGDMLIVTRLEPGR